jgi:hypothetical protein
MNNKQKRIHRNILEAIEAEQLVTRKVDLRSMDITTARALNQLRQANYVAGIFHDIVGGSIIIENLPILTLEGHKYLDELRSTGRRNLWRGIAIFWATIIGLSSIVSAIYYWQQLFKN